MTLFTLSCKFLKFLITWNFVSWDRKFILHHLVALSGFIVSEYTNIFALANAVNIAIAEIGGMMYNVYSKNRTLKNYIIFVIVYGISRVFFAIWSICVYYQIFSYKGKNEFVSWAPYAAAFLQTVLMIVNLNFFRTHICKLRQALKEQ